MIDTPTRRLWSDYYEKYRQLFEISFWLLIAILTTWINGLSTLDDHLRLQHQITTWQPYVWEATSQFNLLLLIPLMLLFDRHYSLSHPNWAKHLSLHMLATLVFSSLHVLAMVLLRKLIYLWADSHYDFGNWFHEFLYEYRKDFITYWQILFTVYAYRFIVSRLYSEAHEVSEGQTEKTAPLQRFLVKKLGREFIVNCQDIDWIEAAGNYMNLHVGERIYPLRDTMSRLEHKLGSNFVRIHRSYMVNIAQISEIQPLDTGDYQLTLKNGHKLSLSRRYRQNLQQQFDN